MCLPTIYKTFERPHLYYADLIYDTPGNESFKYWLEKIQFDAALEITGTIRVTSREPLHNDR